MYRRQKSPLERMIALQDLQRKLAYIGYDELGLRFLDALRNEAMMEMEFLQSHPKSLGEKEV